MSNSTKPLFSYRLNAQAALRALFDTLSARSGIPVSALSIIVANDRAFYVRLAKDDWNQLVGGVDLVAGRFATIWPANLDWPVDTPRPAPASLHPVGFGEFIARANASQSSGLQWPTVNQES